MSFATYYRRDRRVVAIAPTNSVAPVASGTVSIGSSLSCTQGTWANTPTSYAYQWRRDGANIGGATSSSYTVVAADIGASITCRVTASNAGGSGNADSNSLTYSLASDFGSILRLYLRGDLGRTLDGSNNVETWADQSGNGRTFTQATASARPGSARTWNGRAVIDFDGTNDLLSSSPVSMSTIIWGGGTQASFWSLVAMLPDNASAGSSSGFGNQGAIGETGGFFYPASVRTVGGNITVSSGYYSSADRTIQIATGAPAGNGLLIEAAKPSGAGNFSVRVNAGAASTLAIPSENVGGNGAIRLGDAYSSQWFDGAVGVIILCNAVPSATQIANARALSTYLYGVTS